MDKKIWIWLGALAVLLFVVIGFILSQNRPLIYQGKVISEDYLDDLRLKAKVECLQNSQCSDDKECLNNKCIEKSEINLCQNVGLYSGGSKLKTGDSINSVKSVFTDGQLPYLLSDGKIVEIIDNNLTEYLYAPAILIGANIIEKENNDYVIKINNEPVYTYRLTFSRGVYFSNENIQGQILRILGKEYVIDSKSDNSKIVLVSNDKKIKLEEGKKAKIKDGLFFNDVKSASVNIVRGEDGNVVMFEIGFNMHDKDEKNLKIGGNYADSVFEGVKLSFNNINYGFADVRIGGRC